MKCSSKSLLIHIRGGADEFFYTTNRDEIMDLVKRLYAYSKKDNLPVFAPAESKLVHYCTTKDEGEQGLTRMPSRDCALPYEDILEDGKDDEPESPKVDKFDEIPARNPTRHDPNYAKHYNNEDYLKKQQNELKDNKENKVIRSKMIHNKPAADERSRGYVFNQKLVKPPNVSRFQKWSSEDTPNDFESDKLLAGTTNLADKRHKAPKDDAHKKYSPSKNQFIDFEEEKIEIVYEEVDDEFDESPKCRTDVSLDDFRVRKVIDKGSFGEVFLTEYLPDGKKYAMKRIKKSILTDKSLKESTENEKEILMNLNHPFLLTMTYLIENEKRYYFFLEYIAGGNMYKNMFKVKRFEEEAVKFYVAQLALGLNYLHENNLVHRDLKLENVLMGEDGYIKLCDFGLAKLLNISSEVTYTFCGTTEYLAPEIVSNSGHSFSVDWWTLGIICYELCCGRTPFFHKNPHMVTKLIQKGKLIFPDPVKHKIFMSEEMKDFITKLLIRNPEERLGHNNSDEIFNHPWLETVKLDKIKEKLIKPPYYPECD